MMVDKRFTNDRLSILRSMIGKTLLHIRCDPFIVNNMVYRVVGLFVDADVYKLQNEVAPQSYFGALEDICNLSIDKSDTSAIHSALVGVTQTDIPINAPIVQIGIISESQLMYHNGQLIDEYRLVRSIVFVFPDGREIAFDKTDDFSEHIAIVRGHDLLKRTFPVEDDCELESGYFLNVTHDIMYIS